MCFVYVDSPIASGAGCTSNDQSFRWDISSPIGKSTLSMLIAAQMADKTVTFGESGCFGSFPAFAYILVLK